MAAHQRLAAAKPVLTLPSGRPVLSPSRQIHCARKRKPAGVSIEDLVEIEHRTEAIQHPGPDGGLDWRTNVH